MTQAVIQIYYRHVSVIVKRLEARQNAVKRCYCDLEAQAQRLRQNNWIAYGADEFQAQIKTDLERLLKLERALLKAQQALLEISSIMNRGEDEAVNCLSVDGGVRSGSIDFQGFAGGGGFSGVGGKDGAKNMASWQEAIIAGKPFFKFAGDVTGFASPIAELLIDASGIPTSGTTAVIGNLALIGWDTTLTYLEHYDEEPDLMRGGSIAATNAVMEWAAGKTGVGTAVLWGNSTHQMLGTMYAASGYIDSKLLDIPPEMRTALENSSKDYYNVVADTDLGNLTYEASRLYYDFQHDPGMLMTDAGRALDTTIDFAKGAWNYPDAFIDHTAIYGLSKVTDAINNTSLPEGIKDSFSDFATETSSYLQNTGLVDTVKDIFF